LRITRETELLGSDVTAKYSRENIVLQAKFLSGDLPYFAELLAEVASQTKYAGELVFLWEIRRLASDVGI
jgi:ubiquinol-cytochrome c reductase core subunit 2